MSQTNWKDIAELIGISAIVASLIFVGLQMKQAQEIAIAAQYHQRAALAVDSLNAELEAGDLRFWGRASREKPNSDVTIEDLGRMNIRESRFLFIMDNLYFQYQAGFMEEEAWQATRGSLKHSLTSNDRLINKVRAHAALSFRQSFIDLCDELVMEEPGSESNTGNH